MKCPVCANDLMPLTIAGVTLDACVNRCGGIWFDNFELNRFLDQAKAAEQVLQQVRPAGDGFFDYSNPRTCPRCGDVKLLRHFATRKRQVELDSCGGCGGHWLDANELARLRRERAAAKGEAAGPA